MPDYKLKDGSVITEQELALYAEDLGMTPEEFLEERKDLFDLDDTTDLGKDVTEPDPKTKEGIQAIVDSIVPENSLDESANRYFNLKNGPQKTKLMPEFSPDGTVYLPQPNPNYEKELEQYLGENYSLYKEYEKDKKLDLSIVPPGLIDNVILGLKKDKRDLLYRELTEEGRAGLVGNITSVTPEQIEASKKTLTEDQDEYYDVLRTEEFKKARLKQAEELTAKSKNLEVRLAPYLEERKSFEQDLKSFEEKTANIKSKIDALGNVNEYSEQAVINQYNALVAEYQLSLIHI